MWNMPEVLVAVCVAASAVHVVPVPGHTLRLGQIEVHGVQAGPFAPAIWQANALHLLPDVRSPLLQPQPTGPFRNIYAPSAVRTPEGWRVFYGAWDGVETPNDRIYCVDTPDFLRFGERTMVIDHGAFIHACNVSALRNDKGGYHILCTVLPHGDEPRNKPAYFSSPDGKTWNGSPMPYPARTEDVVEIQGYDRYAEADINGMNVLFREGNMFRLYFGNFKDRGYVYRASGQDGLRYTFEGPVLHSLHAANDVKLFRCDGVSWYLMALHMNTGRTWYSLSQDGRNFAAEQPLLKSLGPEDRYIVALGWVQDGNRLLGVLYGAGASPGLDRNRIFARWLQKKVVLVTTDGTRYEPTASLGPDRQVICVPPDMASQGRFETFSEDGRTLLGSSDPLAIGADHIYRVTLTAP